MISSPYYRTGKGRKRHIDPNCANAGRSIFTGDIVRLGPSEWQEWPPCSYCCGSAVTQEARQEAPKSEHCANTGLVPGNPRALYRKCSDCGKEGRVNPKTGTLRAHKPQA